MKLGTFGIITFVGGQNWQPFFFFVEVMQNLYIKMPDF